MKMVVVLGSLVIRVVLMVVGSMKSTIKETVNCSVSSETLSSVIIILKHSYSFKLWPTIACALLSRS